MFIIKLLWPFVKEMIIGKKSFRYALKKNRIKVIFFGLVIASFAINWYLVPKLISISSDLLEAKKQLKECSAPEVVREKPLVPKPVVLEPIVKDNHSRATNKDIVVAAEKEQPKPAGKKPNGVHENSAKSNIDRVHEKLNLQ